MECQYTHKINNFGFLFTAATNYLHQNTPVFKIYTLHLQLGNKNVKNIKYPQPNA